MSHSQLGSLRIAAAILVAMLLTPGAGRHAQAQAAAKPFSQLAGSWSGSGTFSALGGEKEKVRCRVTYQITSSKMLQNLECAGADYKITAKSDLAIDGDKLTGRWAETQYDVKGGATGMAKGNTIYVRIDSNQFSARMSIVVPNDDSHMVNITQFDSGSGRYIHMAALSFKR